MPDKAIITPVQIADCVDRFRARRPHVHCITNSVAQQITANVLLAAGATPSMTIATDEVASFVEMADALLINIGTMDEERRQAAEIAVDAAIDLGKPWALDPVFVQASPKRLQLAQHLMAKSPDVIRCNAGEGAALFGTPATAQAVASHVHGAASTLAVTGSTDILSNRDGQLQLANGSPMMARVTAMGCALTALMAGFCAAEKNTLLATTAAISLFGIAGEHAEKSSAGPGSFVPALLDQLHGISTETIEKEVKIQ